MEDKLVYDGWLKVYNKQIKERKYDILKNYDAVAAIVLNEFNEILLVKQFRPAVMEETLEIPAGCLDVEGEKKETCLVRELKEETNLEVKEENVQKVLEYKPIMGFSNSNMTIFEVHINKDQIKSNSILNDDDVTEITWIPLKQFQKKIKEGKIFDGKTFMSYFYLKSKLENFK
ncbi:MutT/nudix family protein [Clostridium botulinum C str. Eklund]|nr:MutT/nudix family protein [Clostridium botulinum C str. Eklund]KEH93936.1 DNA mismatch repair protein MutT [Clostridium botulinum C/D str. BKT12695]NEZ49131.1 NUDIX hydrolase [Clostridium botulinum]